MFLLKSNDQHLIESISHLLKQKNFFHTLDANQKYFFILNINSIKKELEIGSNVMQSQIILPEGVSLSSNILNNQDQPVASVSVTRAALDIDDEPVDGEQEGSEESSEDSAESPDGSQDKSSEEESKD